VLLADDHEDLLKEVQELLAPSCDVIGAVADGGLLVKAAASLDPDVIVVDVSMPVLNGIQAVTQLRTSGSSARIVFLSVFESQSYVDACFSAGANAYVFKARLASDLVQAINAVAAGQRFVSECHV
jgi:DNA-binding NarL/FixJ family response regulator